jgi:hypothetical protein
MRISDEHKAYFSEQFASLQSRQHLVQLLNEAKDILYEEHTQPFLLKALTFYANPKKCKNRYKTFRIPKKSGGSRVINAPVKGLNAMLKSLNFILHCIVEPHPAATGFVKEQSIVDNASRHVGKPFVYNIDIQDFFHSFDKSRVKYAFMCPPFNLSGDREPLAFLLASLCTHPFEVNGQIKRVLPQGSPTSPTLTNILCGRMDRKLTGLAKRFKATYSRYADDLTFSASKNVFVDDNFQQELYRIIAEDQQLTIHPDKTRLQKEGYRKEATGIVINEKPNVKRRYVKDLRKWLYLWEKYGYDKAAQLFKRDYLADKGHIKKGEPNLANVIDGKLNFLKMVKGEEDSTYLKLRKRFDNLSSENDSPKRIIEVWEKAGIEEAMKLFYDQQN